MTRPTALDVQRFSSFGDAWRSFNSGGPLVPIEVQRARFTAGRAQYLTFQAPVVDQSVINLALDLQDELADIDSLVPMSPEHLHVSIRAAGFQVIEKRRDDEVLREDVSTIGERAARILPKTNPIQANFGPVNVFPDALILEVHDDGALAAIREQLAAVTDDALGLDDAHYLPHITIAWFAAADAAEALRERLPALRDPPPLTATLKRIEFARWWFTGVDATEELEVDIVRSYLLRG